MRLLKCSASLISFQIFLSVLNYVQCCNFGPGNLGLFNYGVGNVGFFNYGVGNTGLGNKGFLNGGALNTGFAQLGLRNIGALNLGALPNTIGVLNIPVAPNFTPPIPVGKKRRRRSTITYPDGKFPWKTANARSLALPFTIQNDKEWNNGEPKV